MNAKKRMILKNTLFVFGIICFCTFFGSIIGEETTIEKSIIYVDDDADPGWYDATHVRTIQEGINNATVGDTVYVYNGTYYENLIINKSINIIGQNKQDTIIDGVGFENVVNISIDHVTISNLSMRNGQESIIKYHNTNICTLLNCNILPDATYGVWCYYSENISINNNSFSNKGIHLTGKSLSDYVHNINGNIVNGKDLHYHKNKINFILDSLNIGQLILVNCTNTEVKNITINNTDFGIELHYNNNTKIDVSNISDNYINIGIYSSTFITISNSKIDNSRYGIYLCYSNLAYIKSNIITNHNHGVLLYSSTNVTIQSNSFAYNGHGIQTVPIQPFFICKARIMNNDFSNNLYHDITLWFNHENIVKHNNCSNSNFGIYLSRSDGNLIMANNIQLCNDDGMVIAHSHNNSIEKNIITSYDQDGIDIVDSNNNTLSDNYISNGEFGIHCTDSINNSIINNTVSNNEIGINVNIFDDDCHNNTFYHNNFIDNLMNVNDEGTNSWDNGYTLGGNYYDNYIGTDTDGDGIGESPYDIPGVSNQDLYPFIEKNGWLKNIEVNQDVWARGFPIRHALDGDWAGAQSFKTSDSSLTRVDVYLRRFGNPEFNLTLEIREDSPDGTLIESFEFQPDDVDVNWGWINLDLIDIDTTPGTDYFIVCPPAPPGVTTSFGYEWGYAFGNQYDDGAFWFTRDGGGLWRDLPTMYEFVFKTYGYS